MKALFLTAALTVLCSAESIDWTSTHADALEQKSIAFAAALPKQTVIIGRIGRAETRVAVVISKEGHLIAPYLRSIDGEDVPYLLYLPDGSRRELTTLKEIPKRSLALLKIEGDLPNLSPVTLSDRGADTVFVATCSPIASLGERASFVTEHVLYQEKEEAFTFMLGNTTYFLGAPVFDISGSLVGFTIRYQSRGTRVLKIDKLISSTPELDQFNESLTTAPSHSFPKAPKLTKEEIKTLSESTLIDARSIYAMERLPKPLPCVLIANEDKQLTHSISGTIVREDGLILTKASELGPALNVRYANKNYPGVILAIDEKSDLALVGITEKGMPVVTWNDEVPETGSTLYTPMLLQENTEDMAAEESAFLGSFTGLQAADVPTVQSMNSVTSLGLVVEQVDTILRVAAILPGAQASKSGLSVGDAILSIDGKETSSRSALSSILATHEVGEQVKVAVSRGDSPQTFTVTLQAPQLLPPMTGVNAQGPIFIVPSVRRSPFPACLVHSSPLNAWDCGSPVFDRKGRALGLNIAAASPGKTLALSPAEVRAALKRLLTNSRPF